MITVYGLLGDPGQQLRTAVEAAEWVVGGRRHLDALHVQPERRIELGPVKPALEQVSRMPAASSVAVIASGDPGFFGILRSLRASGVRPRVVAAPSSISAAFAAVGMPSDDAVVVSTHGRALERAINIARATPKVAVFTAPGAGIRELAAGLSDLDRTYVLAERLGHVDEMVQVLDTPGALAADPREPNVVIILREPPEAADTEWSGAVSGPSRSARPAVGPAAAVAFCRLLPEPGERLVASGPLAAEVAALARWAGAAVDVMEAEAVPASRPDLILAEAIHGTVAPRPRAVVLTGQVGACPAPGFRWFRENVASITLTTGVAE